MASPKSTAPETIRTIRFRQSGGFAGLLRGTEIALAELPAAERKHLLELIRDAGLELLAAGARSAAPSPARDVEEIEIEIATARGTTRYALTELDLPERAAPLVAWLKKRARPIPLDRG